MYEYGFPINTAAGLLEFSQAVERDPSLGISERIRFSGTEYTWADLAYRPARHSFRQLFGRIEAQVGTDRVYFVEGVAKYGSWDDNIHAELRLLRVMADLEDTDKELWVFMPNTADFRSKTTSIDAGQRVAVVANRIVRGRHQPAIQIEHIHQIEIVREDQ